MTAPVLSAADVDALVEGLSAYANDPWAFVMWAFPWGEEGTPLEDILEPSPWQKQVLCDLRDDLITFAQALRIAIKGGKGGGKSALIAMIVLWAFSTMAETRGRVTANTRTQLETVTWAEVNKWFNMFIANPLFELAATSLHARDKRYEKTWRIDAMPWSAENPDAFRGLHNYGKRIILITDECSGIADIIWEALDGCTTDDNTQVIWIAPSNPSRNFGRFRDCFPGGKFAHMWKNYTIDTRNIPFTNKELIAGWKQAWGEDSDYFRVNVMGEFPSVSSLQLIPTDAVIAARKRVVTSFITEPYIMALDVARFGDNKSVLARRVGNDMRTRPRIAWRGLDLITLGNKVAAIYNEERPDALFVDEGGVGGGVVDFLRSLGIPVIGVNFGSKPGSRPSGTLVANKRAEMYVLLRDWLVRGGCIEDDDNLAEQLVSTEYGYNQREEILLEDKESMRKRGVTSPDDADAYALTFAFPVTKKALFAGTSRQCEMDYDPMQDGLPDLAKPRFKTYAEMMN